jgi:hypothetical protein
MRTVVASFVAAGMFAAVGPPVASAPGQQTYPGQTYPGQTTQTTPYPGQMTPGQVWIQNRGQAEAVPVDLRDVNTMAPLRVQVVSGDVSTAPNPGIARSSRQPWEYATVRVSGPDQAASALADRGADGWETTGVTWTGKDGTTLLLKRPR